MQSTRPAGAPGGSAWGYYLVAGLAAVMGLVFLNNFRQALVAQKTWTPAAGRVTESKVVRYRSRRSTSYSTFINYSYAAGGAIYGAGPLEINRSKIYFSEGSAEEDMQENFPPGKSLDVYYNPSNPHESSLGLPGASGLVAPILFFLFSAGLVSLALRLRGE
ncbi:MAG: DUF3592 domain-containing protein [Elusimicrobiota bacterium]|nr:DUF3592 domain-containing protein [Elusimicrobiota bacterium]